MSADPADRHSDELLDAQATAFLRRSPSAIAVTDAHDVIVEWNPEATRLFGYERGETIGRELGELLLAEEEAERHRDSIAAYIDTGDPATLERGLTTPCRHHDGTRVWASITSGPMTGTGGEALFVVWLRQMHRRDEERRNDPGLGSSLEALINNMSDVITVLDPHGEWILSSGAGSRLLGWEPNLDPEGGIYALVHPDDLDSVFTAFAEVVDGTRTSDDPIDIRVLDADGRYHILETVAENLIDDPRIGGVVLTSRDVTAARAAHHELASASAVLAALVASFGDAVMVVDSERRVELVNDAFLELFDSAVSHEDWIGRQTVDIADIASEIYADAEATQAIIEQRYLEETPTFGEIVTLLDGRIFERDSIPVIDDTGTRRHMWVHRDITEREEIARRRLDQLEDSLRAHRLAEQQNQALLELTEMRSQFVATTSHELRTPLASIVSFADLLRGDLADDRWAEQRTFLDAIERNAQRLLRLVDDLLLLRQFEAGAMRIDRATGFIDDVIKNAVRVLEPLAATRRQQLTYSVVPGPAITADLGRLDQVLVNLLSNAVKYTPEEGIIEVAAQADDTEWTITVSDTGDGIGEEQMSHLFEHFYRGEQSAKGTSGTGLGLAISKAVVELHGGTIHVASNAGPGATGTTVTIALPISPPAE